MKWCANIESGDYFPHGPIQCDDSENRTPLFASHQPGSHELISAFVSAPLTIFRAQTRHPYMLFNILSNTSLIRCRCRLTFDTLLSNSRSTVSPVMKQSTKISA